MLRNLPARENRVLDYDETYACTERQRARGVGIQDSPLHSLTEVRRAVLAELWGWQGPPAPLPYDASPAGPSFISTDEDPASRPRGALQVRLSVAVVASIPVHVSATSSCCCLSQPVTVTRGNLQVQPKASETIFVQSFSQY